MHQKIELEAEQHAEHIHAAANPSNESLRKLWEQHVYWTRFFMATPHRKRSEIVPNVIE